MFLDVDKKKTLKLMRVVLHLCAIPPCVHQGARLTHSRLAALRLRRLEAKEMKSTFYHLTGLYIGGSQTREVGIKFSLKSETMCGQNRLDQSETQFSTSNPFVFKLKTDSYNRLVKQNYDGFRIYFDPN